MATWNEYLRAEGTPPEWPYEIKFGEERIVETDVLVLGGGIAGCWAAITAARNGARVALMEKGDVRRSGSGGPGCDHWCVVPGNPLSRVTPDEMAILETEDKGPYSNGIGTQIQCREDFDTLLEMEQMGGKIRDTDDEYVGVEGRDPETKFMISPRYSKKPGYSPHDDWKSPNFNPPEERKNLVIRIWGSTFKPALKKECLRSGVTILERVMATKILNENGKQGARVVGALGFNVRTGEFLIVKAKAVIIAAAGPGQMWNIDMENGGYCTQAPRNQSGDGAVMAWQAGAKLTMMECNTPSRITGGQKHKWYTGAADASYENVQLVDANNKPLPAPTQGWVDGGAMFSNQPQIIAEIRAGIKSGEYELPFYGDFPAMKPIESEATWHMMLTEESTTKAMVQTMDQDGFDKSRDQILNYTFIEAQPSQQYRTANRGGLITDWDLMTNVAGLFGSGTSLFSAGDHSFAASTGRYAGRKAAAFAAGVEQGEYDRAEVDAEKERILAPTKRSNGLDWKELHHGLTRVMQYFAGEFKSEKLLTIALHELERLEKTAVPMLCAPDPHKLMRSLEDVSLIQYAKLIVYAMLERRFTNPKLNVERVDFPQNDEKDAANFLVLHQENDKVVYERVPTGFYGNMKENYEAHNPDYAGVYQPKN